MQLNLRFVDLPQPTENVWATLSEEQRAAALDVLARLIAQTVEPVQNPKDNVDE